MTPITKSRRYRIVSDFKNGLTVIGLARKYGLTNKQVQEIIRDHMKKQRMGY